MHRTHQVSNVYVEIDFVPKSDGSASPVATGVAGPFTIAAGTDAAFKVEVTSTTSTASTASATPVELWSVPRPFLYSAQFVVKTQARAVIADSQNVTFGVRDVALDPNEGMRLNGQHVKMRGFCDHSYFGGVGGAVPDRVNLFRAQTIRRAGGNAWRMAHNPPQPIRLDIMDRRVGMRIDRTHHLLYSH
jgi:beta-galactosidase/beta-glucuronidase